MSRAQAQVLSPLGERHSVGGETTSLLSQLWQLASLSAVILLAWLPPSTLQTDSQGHRGGESDPLISGFCLPGLQQGHLGGISGSLGATTLGARTGL